MGLKKKAKSYIAMAEEMGAADAVFFKAEDICWDSRTLLKCMYGCSDWGKNHTCPEELSSIAPQKAARTPGPKLSRFT